MKAEAGIDYLSCTIPLEHPDCQKVLVVGHKLQKEEQREGNSYKQTQRFGYEGASCGQVFVGTGVQGALLQVSGFSAHKAFKMVKPYETKITRIDLQVTVWYDDDPMEIIRTYARVAENDAKVADNRTKRTIRKVEQNDGGYTLYVGARTSSYFGRLYDKARESKDVQYKNALRFEVEIKQERAQQAYDTLQSTKGDKNTRICAFVGEWYTARGIRVPFLYSPSKMELEPIRRDKSDTARRLDWLRSQVRHTVLELRKTVDSTVILEALGFFEPIKDENRDDDPESAPISV